MQPISAQPRQWAVAIVMDGRAPKFLAPTTITI